MPILSKINTALRMSKGCILPLGHNNLLNEAGSVFVS